MAKKNPSVDAYIDKSADFAKPILNHLRKLAHQACPEVEEEMKWKSPFFLHKGIFAAMMAFKQHCALIFWKRKLVLGDKAGGGMGPFRRITSLADLPGDKELLAYFRKAVELNAAGVKVAVRAKPRTAKVVVPDYFLAALKKNKKALAAFEVFSPSHQREYVQWIAEAKREETRAKRIESAIQMLSEGKSRNWKYECK